METYRKMVTKEESEWAPNKLKHSGYFPNQYNSQETSTKFHRHHPSNLIILVQDAQCPINHKSEKSMHGADIIQHVTVLQDNATKQHQKIETPHHLLIRNKSEADSRVNATDEHEHQKCNPPEQTLQG